MVFNPKIRDGNLPTGKGTFIWLLPRLVDLFDGVEGLVAQLAEDGYQWVCVKAQHGFALGSSPDYDPERQIDLLDELVPAAEAAGIEMHGWGYNFGNTSAFRRWNDQQGKETARIVEALVRWRFRSWTLNAESEFKVSGGNTAAFNLTNLVRETLAAHTDGIDVPIGLSSYRFVSSHQPWQGKPGFPFWGFLQGCDFSGPQVYWQKSNFPVDQLVKSVREWNAVVGLPIVAAGTIYPEGEWWPTGEQVIRFSEAAKEMPEVIATCYWAHYYPLEFKRADLIAGLKKFDWPAMKIEEEEEEKLLTDEEITLAERMLAKMDKLED